MVSSNTYSVALQPICDGRFLHVADKLLYRAQAGANHAEIDDPLLATARACSTAFYEVGLEALVGSRLLFFTATSEWVINPEIMPLSPQQLVADIPAQLFHQPSQQHEMIARLSNLREQGFRICLDDTLLDQQGEALMVVADFVKVDIRREDAYVRATRYQGEGLTLIATFVEQRDQLEQAKQAGFQLFQGYVFSPPNHVQAFNARRSSNPAAEMQLLAELACSDPDQARLESLLAQHPHLCNLVLRQLNTAAHANLVRPVSSLREAIQLLGTRRLKSMVMTMTLSRNDPVQRLQLRQVIIRAAICRYIARRLNDVEGDMAFTLGLLSLIGRVEGASVEELVDSIPLEEDVKQALISREGNLGRLLSLVERFEVGDVSGLNSALVDFFNEDYLAAVAWTEALLSDSSESGPVSGSWGAAHGSKQ
ncbi:MAG: HDOD domain-containing protein [Halomonas sp.]|nr:HDOD domain-containing protein [Halomonas sp.]MDP3536221.1 HDOD domain-containing protein [Halomonas sp.]